MLLTLVWYTPRSPVLRLPQPTAVIVQGSVDDLPWQHVSPSNMIENRLNFLLVLHTIKALATVKILQIDNTKRKSSSPEGVDPLYVSLSVAMVMFVPSTASRVMRRQSSNRCDPEQRRDSVGCYCNPKLVGVSSDHRGCHNVYGT